MLFFQQKSHENEVLSWFGINLMVSFRDITKSCASAKISRPAEFEMSVVNLKLAIGLY